MKKTLSTTALPGILGIVLIVSGCGVDEDKVRQIAREEAGKVAGVKLQSPAREKFGFGIVWEKEYSYAQGVKASNMVFVSGQLAQDTEVDEAGNPKQDLMTGKNFEQQFRTTLENIKKVLAHYDSTPDDVVFLQIFVDREAGGNKVGDYYPAFASLISEFFPKGQHAMTLVEVDNLFGSEQLVEANAIAVVKE